MASNQPWKGKRMNQQDNNGYYPHEQLQQRITNFRETADMFLTLYGDEDTMHDPMQQSVQISAVKWGDPNMHANYQLASWNSPTPEQDSTMTQLTVINDYPDGQQSITHYVFGSHAPGFISMLEKVTDEQAADLQKKFAAMEAGEPLLDYTRSPELEVEMLLNIVSQGLETKIL